MQPPQNSYNQPGSSSGQPGAQPNYGSQSPAPVGYGAPLASPTDAGVQYGGLQQGSVPGGLRTIRRVNVLSAAKVAAVLSSALTAIFGLFFLIFGGPILASLGRGGGAGLAGGFIIGYLFVATALYGIIGGIFGAIYAAIYNLVAGITGGLQIEIE